MIGRFTIEPDLMKIFLQHKETSLFLRQANAWTVSYQDAMDFEQSRWAAEFAEENRLHNVRILVILRTQRGSVEALPFEIPAPQLAH
jgi:hypothetical protein